MNNSQAEQQDSQAYSSDENGKDDNSSGAVHFDGDNGEPESQEDSSDGDEEDNESVVSHSKKEFRLEESFPYKVRVFANLNISFCCSSLTKDSVVHSSARRQVF